MKFMNKNIKDKKSRIKYCRICGGKFSPTRSWHRYCSKKCKYANAKNRRTIKLDEGRYCRQCGKKFYPQWKKGGRNFQHCSLKCSTKSARESRCKFFKKNPNKHKEYHKNRKNKVGTDSNLLRFYLRYPNAPKKCQACGEDRVLDISHKPKFRRNGAWRSAKNTTIDRTWILCPTCHALIDRKHYNPKDLGLK